MSNSIANEKRSVPTRTAPTRPGKTILFIAFTGLVITGVLQFLKNRRLEESLGSCEVAFDLALNFLNSEWPRQLQIST
jgi:hypothetical protein